MRKNVLVFVAVFLCMLFASAICEELPGWYPNSDGSALYFPLKDSDCYFSYNRVILSSWFYYKRADCNGKNYEAINIPTNINAPVYVITSGYVCETGYDKYNGMYIAVKCKSGLIIYYEHLGNWNVINGQYVQTGNLLGWVGRTGRTTGCNLRVSAKYNGKFVCISNYFGRRFSLNDSHKGEIEYQ